MAGTALYVVSPLHTYQRRLMNAELRVALQDTHLYVVSRRPRTTVSTEGQAFGRPHLTTMTVGGPTGQRLLHRTSAIGDLRVRHDGAYWEGRLAGRRVHGEAWHLAALLSDRDARVSRHEVLYVGRALGHKGSRNVELRTQAHSKLQRIYEDHHASDWDVFVTPLVVDEFMSFNDDHIDDNDHGLGGGLFDDILRGKRAALAKSTVYTVEHLLIAYFHPPYNEQLLQWSPAKHFDRVRAGGYRLLAVQFQSLHELTQFFTKSRTQARTHNIVAEVPNLSTPTGFGIGTWDDLPADPPLLASILASSARSISTAAAGSPGLLRIFGDRGPTTNPDFSGWSQPV